MSSFLESFVDDGIAQRCTAALRAIPWNDPALLSKRKNVSYTGDRVRSFVLGLNPATGEGAWYMHDPEYSGAMQRAYRELCTAMRSHRPNFVFHQITLNLNLKCKKHRDAGNVGTSYIIGFGAWEGGEFVVWDDDAALGGIRGSGACKAHGVRHRFVEFDGRTQWHETASFRAARGQAEPERITAVFFSAGPDGKWLTGGSSGSSGGLAGKGALANTAQSTRHSICSQVRAESAISTSNDGGASSGGSGRGGTDELTEGQRRAVAADPHAPLAIVAGAGCGKTYTLVRRVARVVAATGCSLNAVRVDPRRVCAPAAPNLR